MLQDNQSKNTSGHRALWFNALLLLDAFVAGGVVALILVNQLLETIMARLLTIEAAQEILNVLDHLLPYWVGYIGASLLLGVITLVAFLWLWLRTNTSTLSSLRQRS